jgi:hypothetical protein
LQSAVSQVFNLLTAAHEQRSADCKSAIRQIKNLRYAKHVLGGTPTRAVETTVLPIFNCIVSTQMF